jgi:hypothetical protein
VTIEQYLRLFTANTQDDWDKWLTIATVVHNSWPNATTKVAPSQAMLGYLPDLTGTKIQTPNETISQRQEQAEQWRMLQLRTDHSRLPNIHAP